MTDFKEHVKRASELLGGQEALGKAIGRRQSYISFLLRDAKSINASVAIDIESATGGKVTRAQLRPDIFGEVAA